MNEAWICVYHFWDGMITGFYDAGDGVHWFDLDEEPEFMGDEPRTYNVWKVDYASDDVDFTFKPCWDPDFQISELELLELAPLVDPPASTLPPRVDISDDGILAR